MRFKTAARFVGELTLLLVILGEFYLLILLMAVYGE
jgi:hypothetical protein